MKHHNALAVLCVAATGLALPIVAAPIIGRTMAIAAPAALFDWLRSVSAQELGILLWDVAVVFAPSVGVLVLAVSLLSLWIARTSRWSTLLALLTGVALGAYVAVPLLHGLDAVSLAAIRARCWWGLGFEATVLLATGAALLIHSRLRRSNASTPGTAA